MQIVTRALAVAAFALGLSAPSACAWSGGEAESEGECNPDCLSQCRAECTNSVDADGYDQCTEGCDCGCD